MCDETPFETLLQKDMEQTAQIFQIIVSPGCVLSSLAPSFFLNNGRILNVSLNVVVAEDSGLFCLYLGERGHSRVDFTVGLAGYCIAKGFLKLLCKEQSEPG